MLVLSRRRNETIVIDGRIVISVIALSNSRVKLGIECPRDIPVHRREVYEAIGAQHPARSCRERSHTSRASGPSPQRCP